MFTVFIRTVILYLVSVLAMRLMGKRQVGQLQPYEFVLALMIAELAAAPMENVGTPLLYGIIPILGLLLLHGLATLLSVKSMVFRRLLSGGPSVIIRRGVIQYREMKRLCYTLSDLMEELRAQGYLNIADVGTAVLETNGRLSVFPHAGKRPLTPEDMDMHPTYEGIPLALVTEGKLQPQHLKKCGLTQERLHALLHPLGCSRFQQLMLVSLDTQGMMFIQEMNGVQHKIRALSPQEVNW